jgi:hypothetical protein
VKVRSLEILYAPIVMGAVKLKDSVKIDSAARTIMETTQRGSGGREPPASPVSLARREGKHGPDLGIGERGTTGLRSFNGETCQYFRMTAKCCSVMSKNSNDVIGDMQRAAR